jgi:hypothetical protein
MVENFSYAAFFAHPRDAHQDQRQGHVPTYVPRVISIDLYLSLKQKLNTHIYIYNKIQMSSNNYSEIKALDFCLQEVAQSVRITPNKVEVTNLNPLSLLYGHVKKKKKKKKKRLFSRILFILLLEFNVV